MTELPIFHSKFLTNLEELKQINLVKQQLLENKPILLTGILPNSKAAEGGNRSKGKANDI